jgi:hypothetical protein
MGWVLSFENCDQDADTVTTVEGNTVSSLIASG